MLMMMVIIIGSGEEPPHRPTRLYGPLRSNQGAHRRARLERHIVEVVVDRGRLRTGTLRLAVRRGDGVRGFVPRCAEVDLVGHDVQATARPAILAGVVPVGESPDDGDP